MTDLAKVTAKNYFNNHPNDFSEADKEAFEFHLLLAYLFLASEVVCTNPRWGSKLQKTIMDAVVDLFFKDLDKNRKDVKAASFIKDEQDKKIIILQIQQHLQNKTEKPPENIDGLTTSLYALADFLLNDRLAEYRELHRKDVHAMFNQQEGYSRKLSVRLYEHWTGKKWERQWDQIGESTLIEIALTSFKSAITTLVSEVKILNENVPPGLLENYLNVWAESKYAEMCSCRGYVKAMSKDFAGAVQEYTKAIERDPNFAYAYVGRGSVKCEMQDWAGSIQDQSKAIGLNPEYGEAYLRRGVAKFLIKDKNGALEDIDKAQKLGLPISEEIQAAINEARSQIHPEKLKQPIELGFEKLIMLGQKKGFLTYDDINKALPSTVTSAGEIDEVLTMLMAAQIEVRESDC